MRWFAHPCCCSLPLLLLLSCGMLQIVVLDKMDYCASVRNLESVIDQPNVKVGTAAGSISVPGRPACCAGMTAMQQHA